MYKFVAVFVAVVVCCYAAPEPKPGVLAAYAAAPVVAPAVVTAHSSQVVARHFNTLAAPIVAAAPAVAYTAPYVKAAPFVAAPALHAPYFAAGHAVYL